MSGDVVETAPEWAQLKARMLFVSVCAPLPTERGTAEAINAIALAIAGAAVTDEVAEQIIDAVMGSERHAPKIVPMGANPPLFDGMQPDNDGAWLSRVDVAKRLRSALARPAQPQAPANEDAKDPAAALMAHINATFPLAVAAGVHVGVKISDSAKATSQGWEPNWAADDTQVVFDDTSGETGRVWHPHRGYWAYKTATALARAEARIRELELTLTNGGENGR